MCVCQEFDETETVDLDAIMTRIRFPVNELFQRLTWRLEIETLPLAD